jgi:hypothetical protein
MTAESIFSVVGALGVGSILGGYLTRLWGRKDELERDSRTFRENRYRSSLVWMRCYIAPERLKHFDINDPNIIALSTPEDVKNYSRAKLEEFYYNSLLYAPDFVNIAFKKFIESPNEKLFIELAIAMRNDLWGKRSKLQPDDVMLTKGI